MLKQWINFSLQSITCRTQVIRSWELSMQFHYFIETRNCRCWFTEKDAKCWNHSVGPAASLDTTDRCSFGSVLLKNWRTIPNRKSPIHMLHRCCLAPWVIPVFCSLHNFIRSPQHHHFGRYWELQMPVYKKKTEMLLNPQSYPSTLNPITLPSTSI